MSKHKDKDKDRSRDDGHSRDRERSRDRDHRRRSRDRDRSKERSRRKKSKDRSKRSRSRKSNRRDRSRSKDRARRSRSREARRSYSRDRDRDRDRGGGAGSGRRQRTKTPPPTQIASMQAQITQFLSASLSGLTQPLITQPIMQHHHHTESIRTDFSNLFQSSTFAAASTTTIPSVPNSAALAIAAAKAKDLLKAKNLTDTLKIASNGESVASNGNESSHDEVEFRAALGLGSPENSTSATGDASNSEADKKRKKKSRWATSNEEQRTLIPGMPTILPSNLNPDQQEAYLVQLQIEEISRKLRTGDLGVSLNPEERSPSPEPIYSSDGKRLNTREFRTRKKLEEQRHMLITRMQIIYPEFKPPADYKPPVTRVSDKVLIPQEEHPDINFVGLLIGPRGNTLKAMEKETGAKIIIRGKGSVKEGKVGRKDGQPLPGEDEPLHAFITASNLESVKKAVDKIKEVIKQGIEVPEGSNDLRRMQLRELAQLNGTLRETDGPRCTNCGSTDHKTFLCPDRPNVTNNIVCSACGGAGHISKDCKSKRPGLGGVEGSNNQAKIDEEYMSLMAELGEAPPASQQESQQHSQAPAREPQQSRPYSIFDNPRHQPRPILGPNSSNQNQNQNQNNHNNNSNNGTNVPPLMNAPPPPWHQSQSQHHAAVPPLPPGPPAHPMGQYPPPQMSSWPPMPPPLPVQLSGNMNQPPPLIPPPINHHQPGIPPPPPGTDLAPPGTLPISPFGSFDDDRFAKKNQPPLPPPPGANNWPSMPNNFWESSSMNQPPLPSFLPPPPPPE